MRVGSTGIGLQLEGRRKASSSRIIWICSEKKEKGEEDEATSLCFNLRISTVVSVRS
jgi:hypothetical protein